MSWLRGPDITEIAGADALFQAEGIIRESERNATVLFGFGRTLYSAGGASQCIKAMLYLTMLYQAERKKTSRYVLAARNTHVSFIQACGLLDLLPEWLYPGDEGIIEPGTVGWLRWSNDLKNRWQCILSPRITSGAAPTPGE